MAIYIAADSHGCTVILPSDCTLFIHLGDFVSGKIVGGNTKVLIRGNHDHGVHAEFNLECDALRIGENYFTHEPMERLPRGAAYNYHGHIHKGDYSNYGYEEKDFHRLVKPGEIIRLEEE